MLKIGHSFLVLKYLLSLLVDTFLSQPKLTITLPASFEFTLNTIHIFHIESPGGNRRQNGKNETSKRRKKKANNQQVSMLNVTTLS